MEALLLLAQKKGLFFATNMTSMRLVSSIQPKKGRCISRRLKTKSWNLVISCLYNFSSANLLWAFSVILLIIALWYSFYMWSIIAVYGIKLSQVHTCEIFFWIDFCPILTYAIMIHIPVIYCLPALCILFQFREWNRVAQTKILW